MESVKEITNKVKELFRKDWKNINSEFTEELKMEWKDKEFSYEQCKEWIDAGLKVSDVEYAQWLRDIKKVTAEWMLNNSNEDESRKEYKKYLQNADSVQGWLNSNYQKEEKSETSDIIIEEEKNSPKLTTKVIKKIKTEEEIKRKKEFSRLAYSNVGFRGLREHHRQKWSYLISNKDLKERYEKYGLCKECQQPNARGNLTNIFSCQPCNARRFAQEFKNWTSGNPEVDKFIQKRQLEATNYHQVLEWIPYEKFTDVEYLATGGFGSVCKAKWVDGYIEGWDSWQNKWTRSQMYLDGVVLKSLNDSQNITADFLQEITYHKLFNNSDYTDLVVRCYGISQDPKTKNCLMVMEYIEGGNLRQYLQNNYKELSFVNKLRQLSYIAEGLGNIHQEGLIHRDFHAGNILKCTKLKNSYDNCYITDLGLSRPVNAENNSEVYGVLPYVAPEVLRGKSYTQASDIYSFGIVAYEILTGLPPYCDKKENGKKYYERPHDLNLTLAICQGERPQFQIKIPLLLKNLIERCWDTESKNRPTANELSKILHDWWSEIDNKKDTEFDKQFKKTEESNSALPDYVKFSSLIRNSEVTYTSKFIDTGKITEILKETGDLDYLRIIPLNINEIKLEDSQTEQEKSQIQIPPK